MHAVIISFQLHDLSSEEYALLSAELAPSFGAVPGLLAKVWLNDVDPTRRAGFYLFTDVEAADGFLASALARSVAQNPHLAGLDVRRFAVDQTSTALTQPGITVVPTPVNA